MDLGGKWRAAVATDETRRTFHQPELNDQHWHDITVPGHWSNQPGFADEQAVLFRTRFTFTPTQEQSSSESRYWLCLDGICQQGDVWLNGGYVGNTEGYFVPHRFEVGEQLANRSEHVLAIDVTCPLPTSNSKTPSNHLLGSLIDPELSGTSKQNPGGIYLPVHLRETKSTAIVFSRAICVAADTNSTTIAMRCVFDSTRSQNVVLRTQIAGQQHELSHPAAAGENRVEWNVKVTSPELWWPHSLGDQPLYDLRCDVVVDGEVSDFFAARIGFRSISMRNWGLRVNGEKLFIKGINMLATSARLGDASAEQIHADVSAAKGAGLNMIRLLTHIARPELYKAANELGMMLWQDLPLRQQMARSVGVQAKRQAREAVDLLGHHPSVVLWCAHDEPFRKPALSSTTPPVLGQQKPSWNRNVLDRSLRRILNRTDGSRPVVTHTAVPPNLGDFDGTTSHLWFGWHRGRAADIATAAARVPRMVRFVSAFGAATVAATNPLLVNSDFLWPELDWEGIAASIGAKKDALLHLVAPTEASDVGEWCDFVEAAQAQLLKTKIELLRRLKYRPTGGFLTFYFADPSPAGGFGVLNYDRSVKPSWQALVDACRPVIVVADPLPSLFAAGDELDLAVHVVSDERLAIDATTVRGVVRAAIAGGGSVVVSEQKWQGTIPADSCVLVGNVRTVIPVAATQLTITLSLTASDLNVTNSYTYPLTPIQ